MKTKIRIMRWSASLLAAGYLFQAGGCASNEVLTAIYNEVAVRQAANFLSDFVFFVLDNALVRLTV